MPLDSSDCFHSGSLVSGLLCSLSRAVDLIGEKKLGKAHSLIGRAYKDAILLRRYADDKLRPHVADLSEKLGRLHFESAKKLPKAKTAIARAREIAGELDVAMRSFCG